MGDEWVAGRAQQGKSQPGPEPVAQSNGSAQARRGEPHRHHPPLPVFSFFPPTPRGDLYFPAPPPPPNLILVFFLFLSLLRFYSNFYFIFFFFGSFSLFSFTHSYLRERLPS
ncbi:hypothetical protein DFJ73DRAFT_590349 [Zopfochytrium polystomum]|nr:hypothetical protein DFJ73DRAFT_590349 [Zopfochytrium polystomum]